MGAGNTMGEVGPKLTRARRVGKTVHLVAEDLGKERAAIGAVDGLKFLGKLAKKYDLVWGGDWGKPKVKTRFSDNVHIQRCAVSDQKKLFAGTWYPDADYDPYH